MTHIDKREQPVESSLEGKNLFEWAEEQERLKAQATAQLHTAVDPHEYLGISKGFVGDRALQVKPTDLYQEKVIDPLRDALNATYIRDLKLYDDKGGENTKQHEIRELKKLIHLALRNGPAKLLHHIAEQARNYDGSDYTKRLYNPDNGVVTKGLKDLLETVKPYRDLKPKEFIAAYKAGEYTHSKQVVVERLLEESVHLAEGGRVLILIDDADGTGVSATNLAATMSEWRGIRVVLAKGKAIVYKEEGAYSHEQGLVEAVCLTTKQLAQLQKTGEERIHAALTIAYSVKVNQKTSELHLPKPEQLPELHTKQVIELTHVANPKGGLAKRLNKYQPPAPPEQKEKTEAQGTLFD